MAEEIKKEEEKKEENCCSNSECNCNEESSKENSVEDGLKAELENAKKESAEWKDSYVRKVAEFENTKKRMEREKEEFSKYAAEKIIVKMLEIVDNLERAVKAAEANKDFDGLAKGVEMTLNQAHNMFKAEGVEALEAKGKEFNPYEHHAMMQEETEEHADNTVMEEFQKGYKLKERIIRPALVKVAKNKKK